MADRIETEQPLPSKRMEAERKTIQVMIQIYCRDHHKSVSTLCQECQQLMDYATRRLAHCPFQADKPTCGNCTIHCYRKDMREQVKKVMGYAGPRMIYRHPILALRHLLDSRRPAPDLKKSK